MKVSDLAKELGTNNAAVLDKLRSLRLKAKDGKQELSRAVISVLKRELKHAPKAKPEAKAASKSAKGGSASGEKVAAVKKPAAVKKKPETNKAVVKKAVTKKPTAKKAKPAEKAAAPKAPAKKPPAAARPKKISSAPFVPLKPLAKRKRKPAARQAVGPLKEKPAKTELELTSAAGAGQEAKEEDLSHLKDLEIQVPINVKDLSVRLEEKTSVILKKLMQMGILANINQNLDGDVVRKLARQFGFNLTKVRTPEEQLVEAHKEEEENEADLVSRAPVITLMGHVDHGKTSLLDRIRKSKLVDTEHGGITQHIGAYSVKLPKGQITFLDTPGHEAFTAMRARGAHITDLVILVVAADEGIMPQTEEAIDHARAAGVPIVVALNKLDRRNADPDKVKKQLQGLDLTPEDWGGKTIVVGVSAATGEGVDKLLEMILLEAEMLELKANAKKKASGIVVEAHLSRGKGAVASLIVQSGTLNVHDTIVTGPYFGKIKALLDDRERPIQSAGPSTPVEILGLPGVPEAGEKFYVVSTEKEAKEIATMRQDQLKDERLRSNKKITLEDLYSQIQEGKIKELNVILKSDVQGSLEALKDSLAKIPSEEVKVKFIHTGVGDINTSDVVLAVASNAIIIGFHIGISPKAQEELDKQPVDVRLYRIIYDAVNDVKKALEGLLEPKLKKKFLARVQVRKVFNLSRSGKIAGCYVEKGKVTRKGGKVDVVRDEEVVYSGAISSLKRFKDDVREVPEGQECGISIEGFDKMEEGDILEVYEIESIARKLS